jgi:hypothetical protein
MRQHLHHTRTRVHALYSSHLAHVALSTLNLTSYVLTHVYLRLSTLTQFQFSPPRMTQKAKNIRKKIIPSHQTRAKTLLGWQGQWIHCAIKELQYKVE